MIEKKKIADNPIFWRDRSRRQEYGGKAIGRAIYLTSWPIIRAAERIGSISRGSAV